MKVIFITTESLMDHSYTMVTGLRKHIELDVYFVAKEMTPEISCFCENLNAKFFKRKRFLNPLSFFGELKLLRSIRKQKADLVWFNTLSLAQAILLKLFLKHPLINAHDIGYHPEESDYHGIFSQKITFRIFKNCIAVMSKSQAALFEEQYGFEPYILQLPVIDYYEASVPSPPTPLQNGEGSNANKANKTPSVRFLFFGNILPYKGIETLIKAAEILDANNAEYELNIYGKVRYNHDAISTAIGKLKNVNHKNEFIDYREVYNIYQNNDVIIIPYIHVSQCGPLLIGYNQNLPCITSDQPGFREYVINGKSGLVFNNTPESLAEKMEEVINNPGRIAEMKKFISEEIKSLYSMKVLAPIYIEMFRKHLSVNDRR